MRIVYLKKYFRRDLLYTRRGNRNTIKEAVFRGSVRLRPAL